MKKELNYKMIKKIFFFPRNYFFLLILTIGNSIFSDEVIQYPEALQYNLKSNQGFIFQSKILNQENKLLIFYEGRESFRILYKEKIPVPAFFYINLKIINVYGSYEISLILEMENRKFLIDKKQITIDENQFEYFYDSTKIIKNIYKENLLDNKTQFFLKGFQIRPFTENTFFAIETIQIQRKSINSVPDIKKFL